jgi:methylated-DNA-[protein]-cysteine S-methyltransferase
VTTASPLHGSCLFETALGTCGIAWSDNGVTRLQLPEADRKATERRLRAGTSGAVQPPPQRTQEVIAKLQGYFSGEPVDFSPVLLDLDGVSPFHRKVYDAARHLGWGRTASYGHIAREVGSPGAARAVGQALSRNPVPIIIPCHRVLAGGRRIGGFSAHGGISTKERLLALEKVRLARNDVRQIDKFSFGP